MTTKKNLQQPCPASCEQMMLADRLTSMQRLSRGFAHQIRNPLSSIMLFADILADPKRFARSDQELDILMEIKKNVRIIDDCITRALDVTGQDAVENQPMDIHAIIQTVLQLWMPIIKRAGINVDFSPQPDLPSIPGDRIALQQAIGNLVRNAIEAMEKGGNLKIKTSLVHPAHPSAKKNLVVTCADSGPGLDEEMIKMIFEPFFSTKPCHIGLGLTVAGQIVNRHGGRLICRSSNAGQTVFRIELPVAQRPDSKRKSP